MTDRLKTVYPLNYVWGGIKKSRGGRGVATLGGGGSNQGLGVCRGGGGSKVGGSG